MKFSKFFNLSENQYFLRKENKKIKKIFSKDIYWDFDNHTDPDGKKRDLLNEKKKKLNDLKSEIFFIKNKAKKKRKASIIDMGCGYGFFLSAFGKKWDKHGIEISKKAIAYSKKWGSIHEYSLEKNINIKKKFDFVFSYHVIEHLYKPEKFIDNCYKILKKNGYFIIGTPNFDSGCAKRFNNKYRFFKDKTHISLFSEFSLSRLLEDKGFKILNIDFPYFDTEHFNKKNLLRLLDAKKISPPFYGNIMTFYCKKKSKNEIKKSFNLHKSRIKKLLNFNE